MITWHRSVAFEVEAIFVLFTACSHTLYIYKMLQASRKILVWMLVVMHLCCKVKLQWLEGIQFNLMERIQAKAQISSGQLSDNRFHGAIFF